MTTSALVPGLLPVAVDGHPYLCEPDFQRQTVQVIRQQADQSTEPGEQSLTPLGLWRRSQESWHHGAGQAFLDGKQGDIPTDPHRYRSSKGVDPSTQGQISLLHPTLNVWSTTNTNLFLVSALAPSSVPGGSVQVLHVADGTEVYGSGLPYMLFNTLALQQGTGWTPTNATISTINEFFKLTATSSAAVAVTSPPGTSGRPVDAGRQYGFVFQSINVSGSGAKTPQVNVTWYTSAGATISSTTPVVAAGADSGASGVTVFGTAIAPSTAAYVSMTLAWTANWTNTDVHEIRTASIGPYDDVAALGAPDNWYGTTIQAGQTPAAIQSLTTDGVHVWAALGISGLHRNTAGNGFSTADVPAAPGAGQISLVGYANGYLLAAGSAATATGQETLWTVDDPLGTPVLTLVKTHPNSSFEWTGISPGRNCIYAYGNSGTNGEVYKLTIDPNTGALSTAASFATYLPDGETIHAVQFYAGGIILGTGRGLRLGTADGAGNIDYGPLVPTSWPVRCLEPQDRYCWFGWTKYDTTNSGLGRVDLGFFTDTLTPAWWSDLMTADTSSGDTVAVVTMAPYGYTANQRPPVRVFTVGGKGVYIEDPASRVPSGQLLTGTIRFSTSEPKTTHSLDIRHHALPAGGTVTAEMQRDTSGTWENLGASSTTGSYGPASPISALDETAEAIEFRYTIGRPTNNGTDFTQSVEMTRWTAKVLPLPSTIDETFTLNLHMKATVDTTAADSQPYHIDVATEVAYLKTLEQSRQLVTLQLGSTSFTVYVVQSQFKATNWSSPKREFAEGMLTLVCQTVRG